MIAEETGITKSIFYEIVGLGFEHEKGHSSSSVDNVQRATTQAPNTIPPDNLQGCHEEWKNRRELCVYTQKICTPKESIFNCKIFQ